MTLRRKFIGYSLAALIAGAPLLAAKASLELGDKVSQLAMTIGLLSFGSNPIPGAFTGNPAAVITAIDTTAGILISRSSGYLPAFVSVSAENMLATGTITSGAHVVNVNPYEALEFSWDFGDPTGTEVFRRPTDGATVNANTAQVGPEAAYCYRTAGTKTITLEIRGANGIGGIGATATCTKTFTATAFTSNPFYTPSGSGNTFYADQNGASFTVGTPGSASDTYDGLSPQWTSGTHGPVATITKLMTLMVKGSQAYLARGSVWTDQGSIRFPPTFTRFAPYTGFTVSAAAPIIAINAMVSNSTNAPLALSTGNDNVFSGVNFQIGANPNSIASQSVISIGAVNNTQMVDVYLDNCSAAFTYAPSIGTNQVIAFGGLGYGTMDNGPWSGPATRLGIWGGSSVSPPAGPANGAPVVGTGIQGYVPTFFFMIGVAINGGSTPTVGVHASYMHVNKNILYRWVDTAPAVDFTTTVSNVVWNSSGVATYTVGSLTNISVGSAVSFGNMSPNAFNCIAIITAINSGTNQITIGSPTTSNFAINPLSTNPGSFVSGGIASAANYGRNYALNVENDAYYSVAPNNIAFSATMSGASGNTAQLNVTSFGSYGSLAVGQIVQNLNPCSFTAAMGAAFTANSAGTTSLTVSGIGANQIISPGDVIYNGATNTGVTIVSGPGGNGTYVTSANTTYSSASLTVQSTVLNVTAVSNGVLGTLLSVIASSLGTSGTTTKVITGLITGIGTTGTYQIGGSTTFQLISQTWFAITPAIITSGSGSTWQISAAGPLSNVASAMTLNAVPANASFSGSTTYNGYNTNGNNLTISSGSYNASTGVITLTMAAAVTYAPSTGPGSTMTLISLTGTGAFASLDGAWPMLTASGTTVTLQGPIVSASTITGGNGQVFGAALLNVVSGSIIGALNVGDSIIMPSGFWAVVESVISAGSQYAIYYYQIGGAKSANATFYTVTPTIPWVSSSFTMSECNLQGTARGFSCNDSTNDPSYSYLTNVVVQLSGFHGLNGFGGNAGQCLGDFTFRYNRMWNCNEPPLNNNPPATASSPQRTYNNLVYSNSGTGTAGLFKQTNSVSSTIPMQFTGNQVWSDVPGANLGVLDILVSAQGNSLIDKNLYYMPSATNFMLNNGVFVSFATWNGFGFDLSSTLGAPAWTSFPTPPMTWSDFGP